MKILLLFPMADGQTGPAIGHAFKQLGHQVVAVDAKFDWRNSYDASIRFEPDLVFCSRTVELTQVVRDIKRKFEKVITCVWNVDTRLDINHWKRLFPLIGLCDYHFVPDTGTISAWRRIYSHTFWLPQGVQDEIYDKPRMITDGDRAMFSCDVCWAGTRTGVHRGRGRFLDAVSQMDLNYKQWGCAGAPKIYDELHNKMVALSKINLGCSGWTENEKYTSVRDYKIMGAGGFLLELDRKGLYEIFPSDTLDTYKTPAELVERIRYWLAHDEEREAIAERGYKWVRGHATYKDRIRLALDYMKGELK